MDSSGGLDGARYVEGRLRREEFAFWARRRSRMALGQRSGWSAPLPLLLLLLLGSWVGNTSRWVSPILRGGCRGLDEFAGRISSVVSVAGASLPRMCLSWRENGVCTGLCSRFGFARRPSAGRCVRAPL
jgi:hypothetical protein